MVEILKFMRRYGFRTAKWDTELTCYKAPFFKYGGQTPTHAETVAGAKVQQAWEELNEKIADKLGDLTERPRWFHV
jgi:hypothetical protein